MEAPKRKRKSRKSDDDDVELDQWFDQRRWAKKMMFLFKEICLLFFNLPFSKAFAGKETFFGGGKQSYFGNSTTPIFLGDRRPTKLLRFEWEALMAEVKEGCRRLWVAGSFDQWEVVLVF